MEGVYTCFIEKLIFDNQDYQKSGILIYGGVYSESILVVTLVFDNYDINVIYQLLLR